jgi:RHS repeat-associated protein
VRFVYASRPNTPDFMVVANGAVYKFINDERGSPRLIVNTTTGAVVESITYDEFGNQTVGLDTGAFPAWMQPFGFAGGLYDEDTGLVRFGARDYQAQTGRWLAKDPILFGGGQSNLYVYVNNDPINHTDPSGHWGFAIGGSGGAGFGFPLGGSWDVGSGIVFAFDSTGITIAGYTANTVSIGAGAYLGFGFDGTVFKGDLANFAGTSYGGKLDVGLVEKGDLKVSNAFTKAFAAVCGGLGGASASSTPSITGSAGVGGGLYAGLTRTTTQVEGYNLTTGTLVSY